MWPRSLTFRSRQQEQGFLQLCGDRLLSGLAAVALSLLVGNTVLLLMGFWHSRHAPHSRVFVAAYMSIGVMWLLSLGALVFAKWPKLHGRLGLAQREVACVAVSVLVIIQLIFSYHWYLARLLGINYCDLHGGHDLCLHISCDGKLVGNMYRSDAFLVVVLSMCLLATHFTMHVRWVVLSIVETTVVVFYAIAAFGLGSGDPNPSFIMLAMIIMTFLTALGKRQLEYTERLLFLQLVAERRLRAEAEFELAQTQEEVPKADDAASALTSAAGNTLETITQAEQSQLGPLEEIGRNEQWLLKTEELAIDRHAQLLGTGGYGIVAPGRFQLTPVAFKFAKRRASNLSLASIGNELRVLRKLRHPHIVLFHGACVDFEHRDIVLVIERVVGEPLTAFVRHYHENPRNARLVYGAYQFLLGVCRALVYLHTRQPPIVHGDLKGDNIFMEHREAGPHAKLLDFGLARVLSRAVKPLGGSHRWAAPEVFAKSEPTPAADVFSFGRVIYFLFVGKVPLADVPLKLIKKASRRSVAPLEWPLRPSQEASWCRPLVEEASALNSGARPPMTEVCIKVEAAMSAAEAVAFPDASHPEVESASQVSEEAAETSASASATAATVASPNGFWQKVRHIRQSLEDRGLNVQSLGPPPEDGPQQSSVQPEPEGMSPSGAAASDAPAPQVLGRKSKAAL